MKSYDVIVKNADIVTASERYLGDIGISNGKVAVIAATLDASQAKQVIDAHGRMVTPGGVDAHCHLDQPSTDGSAGADDFISGTRSAACGGTTTVIPFAMQFKGQSLHDAVADYHQRAEGKACIDYAFHLIITDASAAVIAELPQMVKQGYTSFKIYMTYEALKLSDHHILNVLDAARQLGAISMIHAENDDCISWLTERLKSEGKISPRYHAVAHSQIGEREATHRAISLAELVDVPILLVHVSSRAAVEQIYWSRGQGINIFSETCPQYLFLTAEDLGIDDSFHGAKCICSPPPRDTDSQQAVWNALANGTFSIFSSDHCPFNYDDPQGKKLHGEDASFDLVPNGIAGLETRLPLLMSEGVLKNRISAQRFVDLTATAPAKLYGLYPQKGTLMPGSDADLVIWDTDCHKTIHNDQLHSAADYTPYEGKEVHAWPAITLSRGDIVWRDNQFTGQRGNGQFLHCALPFPSKG
ncbi:dihydropyrimidinase [Erwinia toletana]|uniref:Dihydropyrimidinase n=1 Tax=Winslowiella toletana TaxID=92490 RepID=A0ABS4PAB4_9GAMM|nr:dihydropyrimidinase [Winslowiella toletana]MBP2169576.1 dihydropyrimidinase [Winslowiella toletana]